MADPAQTEPADAAMDTQASPGGGGGGGGGDGGDGPDGGAGSAGVAEDPSLPAGIPAAFPKKRRGRPPGRPNMTVREADYEENPLVQAWNAAKSDRAMTVVPVAIRAALTEAALVHDTQRAIFRLPSREVVYFVQGWITARHVASQRPSYVNGLLIHSRGEDVPDSCTQCAERRAKNALGPFLICRFLPGSYHNSCSNCKWFDNTSACSLYTGPKPNRKRKAKDAALPGQEDADQAAHGDGANGGYLPADEAGEDEGVREGGTPDDGVDPALRGQSGGQQPAGVHFAVMQDEQDGGLADAQLAAQLLPEIQRHDHGVSPS